MLAYEKECAWDGTHYGVDEIKDVALESSCCSFVILPKACKIPGLNDTSNQTQESEAVLKSASIGIGIKDNQMIDRVSYLWSLTSHDGGHWSG